MLTPTDQASRATEVIDAGAVAAELEGLVDVHAGNERELRLAVSRRLKTALVEGRAAAERLLIKDRHGRRCAERLCFMLDEIIRVLFEFAIRHLYPSQNPSEAERMAIIATGGYGRGVLAPGRHRAGRVRLVRGETPGAGQAAHPARRVADARRPLTGDEFRAGPRSDRMRTNRDVRSSP